MSIIYKNIHIGNLIEKRVSECNIKVSRICNFFDCIEKDIEEMYKQKDMNTGILLKWSKLLKYDFFRIYTQHLMLFSPPVSPDKEEPDRKSELPQFRKNIYTKVMIDFILELISTEQKTIRQVIDEYKIPKTTLYKWISKYKKIDNT
ncbi:transposase [Chryseobacterium lathyri]|uniref:transposase n=1 Tax=Chryseobacterium lathyri TaxID=395933 RepID=UPI0021D42AD6|nr:transposase [Chryseobacterium lathyri]